MRIVHYLLGIPPVRDGGLVKYVLDMAKVQHKFGEEVYILVPGPIHRKRAGSVKIRKKYYWESIPVYYICNPLPIPMANGIKDIDWFMRDAGFQEYYSFLSELRPNIIHVHSLMGVHQSFFKAAKALKIRMIFTSHDYFGICPSTVLIRNGKKCDRLDWLECFECCQNAFGTLHLIMDQAALFQKFMRTKNSKVIINFLAEIKASVLKKKNIISTDKVKMQVCKVDSEKYLMLQDYYKTIWNMFDFYHFNSYISKRIYEERLGKVPSKVIPILNASCSDNRKRRKYGQKLRVGFLGNESLHKGINQLERVIEKLWENGGDIKLNIYFHSNKLNKEFINQNRPYMHDELNQVFEENDIIVVPSLCWETFGLVVVEALSYGVPVIVSESVGASLLLEQNHEIGYIIEGDLEGKLYEILEQILINRDILRNWNKNICEMSMNFSFENHVRIVMNECYWRNNCDAE